jgi:DNA mismatch repair ATPase MutS
MQALIQIHSQLDAWMSMAKAMRKFNLTFPEFIDSAQPLIQVNAMGHLLLEKPVRYDITLNQDHHFLFLTGANMAGKSTFIKSLGTAVYLAHLGMGVPCTAMKLSLFDGILTNINIQDDITKGESYFYQEVKRIKATVETVNDGKKWLILIDELFKGTNITDAMNCSLQVIRGLLRRRNAVYVLSTHLYEISESLQNESGILFRYFETKIKNDEYSFSYQLREGVSEDKLGMLILKKEGVLDMLKK